MNLSDEQMKAATGSKVKEWEDVPLPEGKLSLPAWVKGLHVDWSYGVTNAPCVLLKVCGSLMKWEDQRWTKEGTLYIARHADGRAQVHHHDGAVSVMTVKDESDPRFGKIPYNDLPDMRIRATTEQNGYGGRKFKIIMDDGGPLLLQGPWHVGAPAGYVEVCTVDMDSEYNKKEFFHKNRPWQQRSACFGLYITEDLFLRIFAKFCPHEKVARVRHSYGVRLEPYRTVWGLPKGIIYQLEWNRACEKQPAGVFWRVYWDARGSYCGRLRQPTYGYRPEVPESERV